MSDNLLHAAAVLRDAYSKGPVAPLRKYLAADDVESAYAVQDVNIRHWLARGRRLVGRKAGLTSRAVQQQLGVAQPDFGMLFADMRVPDGGVLDPCMCLQPKVEAEVAFVLSRDLQSTRNTIDDVACAVAATYASIEIVDSRIEGWRISIADTIADNGSSAFFVLSEEGCELAVDDLPKVEMVLEVNAKVVSRGVGAAVLGNPLNALVWLANAAAAQQRPLRRGDTILSGALGPMVALEAGDRVTATIAGVGECSFMFASANTRLFSSLE